MHTGGTGRRTGNHVQPDLHRNFKAPSQSKRNKRTTKRFKRKRQLLMAIERQQVVAVRNTRGVGTLHIAPVESQECQAREQSDATVIFPAAKGKIADTSISLSLPVFLKNLITHLNNFHSHAL